MLSIFLWCLAGLAGVVALSLFVIRPYVRPRVKWVDAIYDVIDPVEAWLCAGSRTLLVARFSAVASAVVGTHDALVPIVAASGFDWTPFIPEPYQKYTPLAVTVLSVVMEWLRRATAPLPSRGRE